MGNLNIARKLLLGAAAFLAVAVPVMPGVARAEPGQSDSAEADGRNPKFATVSIRHSEDCGGIIYEKPTSDGWEMRHMGLLAPILIAYPRTGDTGGAWTNLLWPDKTFTTVSTFGSEEVIGWPHRSGIKDDCYDIDAKVADADLQNWGDPAKRRAMLRAMLQSMLADRLKLEVHRGTEEATVYALVVGREGPLFKESVPGESHPGAFRLPAEGGMATHEQEIGLSTTEITTHFFGISIGQLIQFLPLSERLRSIRDETGLTGRYDITTVWAIPGSDQSKWPKPRQTADVLEEMVNRLGLDLVPSRGQVETLVIDHVEQPSPN